MSNDPAVRSSGFQSLGGSLRRPVKALPKTKPTQPPLTRRATPKPSSGLKRATLAIQNINPPQVLKGDSVSCSPRTNHIMASTTQPAGQECLRPRKKKKVVPKEERYLREVMTHRSCLLIGDTLDFDGLIDNKPKYTAITPESLLDGLKAKEHQYHAWVAVKQAMESSQTTESRVQLAMDLFLVELGASQLERYPDCHFTFVDPRLAEDEYAIVHKVQSLASRFESRGIPRSSVVFNIPATLSGIHATRRITSMHPSPDRIKTCLILVQGLAHAAACTEAAPFGITLSVGPVLRWHESASLSLFPSLSPADHTGMAKIHSIRLYFEKNRIKVRLLASDCRKLQEIEQLVGFNGVVLPLAQMEELRWATTYKTDAELDLLSIGSKANQLAQDAPFPSTFLSDVATQAKPRNLLPSMSQRTRQMAEHNIRSALNAMVDKVKEVEAYIRAEVLRLEEMAKPIHLDPGAPTAPSSPEKPWDKNRDGSLTDGKLNTLVKQKSIRVIGPK